METPKITREEAMRRFMASKARKKAFVEKIIEEEKEAFRQRTGREPLYVEVW